VSNTLFPSNPYRSIAIDADGNKWIGTQNNGLLKFDGTNWDNFTTENSGLTSNLINHITFDRDGNLWISTNGGGLVRKSRNNVWTAYRRNSPSNFPSDHVNFLIEGVGRQLWVGTRNGLVNIDFNPANFPSGFDPAFGGLIVYTTANSGLPSDDITSIQFQEVAGTRYMWLGTSLGLVRCLVGDDVWRVYNTGNSDLPGSGITNLKVDHLGNKWMSVYNWNTASGVGLVMLNSDDTAWTIFDTRNSDIPSNTIRGINYEVGTNDLPVVWITTDAGIGRLSGTTWTTFNVANTQNAIPTNDLFAIAIEQSNNTLWFGTSYNVLKLSGTTWTSHSFLHAGIPHDRIQTIALENDNSEIKWIGTANGMTRFSERSWIVYNMANSPLPSNDIRALAVDRSNFLWIGTAEFVNIGGGLARYNLSNENQRWEVFTVANSPLTVNTISSIAVCRNNFRWIGTLGGGLLSISPTDEWRVFSQSPAGLASNNINDILVDNQNNKWIATDDGIAVLGDNNVFIESLRFATWNSNLLSNNIKKIKQDNNGGIWAVTSNGLARLIGNDWVIYTATNTNNVLHELGITDIAFDQDNIKWITTNRGLVRTNEIDWSIYTTANSELHSNNLSFITVENVQVQNTTVSLKWMGTSDFGVIVYRGGHQRFPNNAYISVFQHPVITNSLRIVSTVNNFTVDGVRFRINNVDRSHTQIADNTWFTDLLVDRNQSVNIRFTFTHERGDSTVVRNINVGMLSARNSSIQLDSDVYLGILNGIDREHWLVTELMTDTDEKQYFRIPELRERFANNLVLRTREGNQIQRKVDGFDNVWENVSSHSEGSNVYAFINERGDFRVLKDSDVVAKSIADLVNFPNPFNPETTISFILNDDAQNLEVEIFDIRGRRVRALYSGALASGIHHFRWNGTNENGINVSTGVYFIRVQSERETHNRKMLLLK